MCHYIYRSHSVSTFLLLLCKTSLYVWMLAMLHLSDINVQIHNVAMLSLVDLQTRISQSIKTSAGDYLCHEASKQFRRISMFRYCVTYGITDFPTRIDLTINLESYISYINISYPYSNLYTAAHPLSAHDSL